jgi:hypothetical protein
MDKNSIGRIISFWLVFLVFTAVSSQAAGKITILGRIVVEYDEEGNTTAISLSVSENSGDEEEISTYLIDKTGKGAELFDYEYEIVKLTGSVKKDKEGNKIITVSQYEIIQEEILDDSEKEIEDLEIPE